MSNEATALSPWTRDTGISESGPAADQSAFIIRADGRQSDAALSIARGTTRLLAAYGSAVVTELPLPSGRRADLVALGRAGDIWIVEIKSSPEDFRSDAKWPDYRAHCDRLFFAVAPSFPVDMLPAEAGLILADAHGAELVREAPHHPLAGATRKSMITRFGRAAALRLTALVDPAAVRDLDP